MSFKSVRDEIEDVIKQDNIDRSRFGEFSKFKYDEIIKKFYYEFSDYARFASSRPELRRKSLHVRDNIDSFVVAGIYQNGNRTDYLESIKSAVPVLNEKLFLILSNGLVYEGYTDEMFKILEKLEVWTEDFFILSKKYDWFIAHDYIDWCAFMYQKRKKVKK